MLVGLCTFEIGLKFGLVALGYQCGVAVPAAFSPVQSDPDAPLYPQPVGLTLVGCYALLLGGCGGLPPAAPPTAEPSSEPRSEAEPSPSEDLIPDTSPRSPLAGAFAGTACWEGLRFCWAAAAACPVRAAGSAPPCTRTRWPA